MTATDSGYPGNHDAGRLRLGYALCASVAAHAWLMAGLQGSPRARLAPAPMPHGPIEVRLAAATLSTLVAPAATEQPLPEKPVRQPLPVSPPAIVHPPQPQSLPQPVDLTWYGAHELDAYPRALGPLYVGRHPEAGSAGGRLLLWLSIDELGRVVEVKAAGSGAAGELVEAARASLAAAQFSPARKEERAVKSRIQIELSY